MEYNKELIWQGTFLKVVAFGFIAFPLVVISFHLWFSLHLQDLSRVSMPVGLNEPLTFLQKIVEYIEYAGLLHAAAASPDPLDRLAVHTPLLVFFLFFSSLHHWSMEQSIHNVTIC